MTVEYMQGIAERYAQLGYEPYRWYEAESPPPWAPLAKPLAESRLGLLSTAGAYVAGQVAFHYKDDTSIRRIATTTPAADLRFSHITEHYLGDARTDPECMLPLTAVRELAAAGVVGALADEALSCMGGIYSQRRVREELAPAVADAFAAQRLDAALLLPL